MDRAELKPPISDLKRLPHMIAELLERDVGGIEPIAQAHYQAEFFLYLGRHVGLPVALEGALKLKEISYIATDAYAAGEMKHGPIALLDENTPVVVVATESPVLEKVISNIQEVRARGARVIAIATEGDDDDRRARRRGDPGPADRLDAGAAAGGDPAAAARLPHRPAARPQRRPAAQPGQDRHGGVTRGRAGPSPPGRDRPAGDRAPRAGARAPSAARRSACSPTPSAPTPPSRARPGQHLAARFCAKEAVAKALGLEAWSFRDVEVDLGGGGPPEVMLHGAVAERAEALGVAVRISLTHTRTDAGAVAIAAAHD